MRLNEVTNYAAPHVEGYGPGFFRVAGEARQGPLLIVPSGLKPWQGLDDLAPLVATSAEIDVLFLGMGAEMALAPDALQSALDAAGVGVEVMATPTACRTYNVVLGEGRRIGLAVMPV